MQKLSLTIRRKIILPIILTVFAVIGVTAFVACSDEVTEQDIINLGYSVGITYDNNGGIVGNKTDPQFARVKENSLIPTPGINAGIKIPSRAGYSFRGYFYAETDEDGNVKRNEDGSIVISDRQCEFGKHGVSDRDITLCAEWWDNYKINLHYGEGQNEVKTVSVSMALTDCPCDPQKSCRKCSKLSHIQILMMWQGRRPLSPTERLQ